MATSLGGKSNEYAIVNDGNGRKRFECSKCHRLLCSKHSVLYHLYSAHNLSPLKRVTKRYLDDPSIEIPRSTLKRKLEINNSRVMSRSSKMKDFVPMATESILNDYNGSTLEGHPENLEIANEEIVVPIVDASRENCGADSQYENICNDEMKSQSDCVGAEDDGFDEDSDDDTVCNDFSDDEDSMNYDSSHSSVSDFSSDQEDYLLPNREKEMTILSCFLRNKFTASSCIDVISTMQKAFPDYSPLGELSYDKMWDMLGSDITNEIHYCELCKELFPNEVDIYACASPECSGRRYKGTDQMKTSRQPRASFVFANLKRQLKNLLQSPGIWEDVKKNKQLTQERHKKTPENVTDITDGLVYKGLTKDNNFLNGETNTNLTAVFNTDGINLYSSSKVELWPLFLVVNELSPRARFARENMILAGIWQGKGKPPFKQYLQSFSFTLNDLYANGISLILDNQETVVKLAVICATLDLPAKAGILNMTLYNGAESCITCEDPGMTVRQGKGYSRCFPYRKEEEKYLLRTEGSIRSAMENSDERHRIKGFKGLSGLAELKEFHFVTGIPPDYMHGVLLGVTKTLMYKWFSSTESKKDYFVGSKLKLISKRLKNIQPPEFIERLPRDLEKHYTSLKATELQAWLLYYALPCLVGILKNVYLEHFALLSEGIYILLGDTITQDKLHRAENLLNLFYSQFCELYSGGSCGLNVHNIGSHLCSYVSKFGPLWCWSCFPFEDSNSMILQAVHGTGNVMHQIIKFKEAQSLLRNALQLNSKKTWTNLKKADNCDIAGAVNILSEDEYTAAILSKLCTNDVSHVKKVTRIVLNGR